MSFKKSTMSLFTKKIKLVHLADIIINHMDIRRNDVLMVYTSLHDLKHADFQPEDFIYLLKMIIGTDGILLMPVRDKSKLTQINTQSQLAKRDSLQGYDLISDAFLQMQDTISLNFPGYTLASWGDHADSITEPNDGADLNPNCISLRDTLSQMKAKFIGFGVLVEKNTFLDDSGNAKSKNLPPKGADKAYNDTPGIILDLFEGNEFKMFTEQGISYRWIDRSK
jgi:aminoglycoside N3'-acetyltransferase